MQPRERVFVVCGHDEGPPHHCSSGLIDVDRRHHVNELTNSGPTVRCVRPFRGRGGIGRHARFRIWWRKPWGFESLRPHQYLGLFVVCMDSE